MRGLRSTDRESQKSPGAVKSSTGDGAAKELAHVTHGHEQGWGDGLREWGLLGGGCRGGKPGHL